MTDKVGKCNMNDTLVFENAFSVNAAQEKERQENDFIDDKVQIFETAITAELQDNLVCEEIKQYDISTILDNIKTELPSSDVQYDIAHNIPKIEKGFSTDDIKIEFSNGFLYCEDCQVYCEDYCANCGMLVLILNRTVPINADDKSQEQLLNNILEIREYCGKFRIFALKAIPQGVKFGPFTGRNRTQLSWKIKGGKIVVKEDKSNYLNWMQYISAARNISEQNLRVFQYKHNLYYQSTRHIQEGDELLVYFGEEYDDSLMRNVEVDFIPTTVHNFKDAFVCTYCCLGFSLKSYLIKHKTICSGNVDGRFSVEELVQCPSCEIHLDQKEYFTYHVSYCCKRDDGKHKEVSHLGEEDVECSASAQVKEELPLLQKQMKQVKCCLCEFRTKYKKVITWHIKTKHLKKFDYKCESCDYKTNHKTHFETHIKSKHLIKFDYKCDTCHYKTNHRSDYEKHMKRKHLVEFVYNCESCDYKANYKSTLEKHMKVKHLEKIDYKCGSCDYKANYKSTFEKHMKVKHLVKFDYKCGSCDYETNYKSHLDTHVKTKHLVQFDYKCELCDYKTNHKSNFKKHVKSKHFKEFDYKCESCDYKTNFKSDLEKHMKSKHLVEFDYNCVSCHYKTNGKSMFEKHTKTKHLVEFDYKCESCDYKTNFKSDLEIHTKSKHLVQFDYKCEFCHYKTNRKADFEKHMKRKHLKECD